MKTKLRYIAAAALLALAPVSVCANTTGYQNPISGAEWRYSEGKSGTFTAYNDAGTDGAYVVKIFNDVADSLRYRIVWGVNQMKYSTVEKEPYPKKDSMSFLTIKYTKKDWATGFQFCLEPVPLPAAALLMLTALGGLSLSRRRRGGTDAAA